MPLNPPHPRPHAHHKRQLPDAHHLRHGDALLRPTGRPPGVVHTHGFLEHLESGRAVEPESARWAQLRGAQRFGEALHKRGATHKSATDGVPSPDGNRLEEDKGEVWCYWERGSPLPVLYSRTS